MKKGTQIAYVPRHADGNINHPDVEFGFVMEAQGEMTHFCRYWQKRNLGALRTMANSELTPNDCLVEHNSVTQDLVEVTIEKIEREIRGIAARRVGL